ncbi:lysozyme inhibitor LprI family protein [Aestuariibius sp. 2305UL40-4]|uniref:lysozyme inhibitor LprI family protein n=1 Tax=Aestuariibius violaceus TaxID=3234132 RepID=UPI00345E1ED5
MTRSYVIIPFTVLAIAGPAPADTAMECGVQVSSQVEVASCVEAQIRVLDQTLDEALGFARDAAAELDAVTEREVAVPALEEAQVAWVAYRDARCAYRAALFGGGSGAEIAEGSCRVAATRQRIDELMASLP